MAKRIWMGLLLVLLFAVMLYLGSIMQMIMLALGGVLAVREMARLFNNKGMRPFVLPAYAFAALFAPMRLALPGWSLMYLWMPLVLSVLIERIFNRARTMEDSIASIVIFVYPLTLFVLLFQLGVSFEGAGTSALLTAFCCPLIGDILAYFIGTLFGKRKLCPYISPKKTVEGSLASLIGAMLGGLAAYLTQSLWGDARLPAYVFLIIGLVCGVAGQLGDLFASSLKRWANIKDFSNLFPGHGGILDRLDSVLFCAPVVYAGFSLYLTLA